MNNGIIYWNPGVKLHQVEKQAIEQAFDYFKKNKTQTANALGISIRTLDAKLKDYENDKRIADEQARELKRKNDEYLRRARGQTPSQSVESSESVSWGPSPAPWARVEPIANSDAEQTVSVPKRGEVQKVLSREAAPSGDQTDGRALPKADGRTRSGISK